MELVRKQGLQSIVIAMMILSLLFSFAPPKAHASDEYDLLRDKWKTMLTGGTSYSTSDTDIAAAVTAITAKAQANWNSLNKTPTEAANYIWIDLRSSSDSSQLTTAYVRIKEMALATQTVGSTLYGNTALIADTIMALEWMNTWKFYATKTSYQNWWDWQIGVPMALNDCVVLLYDLLTPTQISNYMAAVDRFAPTVDKTGANRVWKATAVGLRAVIAKDSVKLAAARDGLTSVFPNVTSGDGFYEDGSFIQHTIFAYTGGYGVSILVDLANLMYLLNGSTWAVTTTSQTNLYQWIYNAYQPLLYKGAIMDMTRGREISRYYAQDRDEGHEVMQGIIRVSQFAPATDALAYKRMIKYWLQAENASATINKFATDASVNMIVLGKGILNDSAITPASELVKYQQFSAMDRAVHLRPGFGFGIGMFSTRINSYESINSENSKGWYSGAGTTYLYNNDLDQFSDDFWPTVDNYRLPGTTVISQTYMPSQFSTKTWVGGTDLFNTYGITGMEQGVASNTLTAKKSWFMFDDEIVALGAGITSTDGQPIESIVENRKINSSGSNALTVNGAAQSTALGWSQALASVQTVHLAGNVTGSDIGYYFPTATSLQAKREARTGNWKQINPRASTPSTAITRNYLTMWLNQGTNPTNQSYQYVILPNKTSAQVTSYASNPNVTILENSGDAQAVKENTLGIVGVNFWNDAVKTVSGITSNKKASVMTKETTTDLDVSVSDPTKVNTGSIAIEINKAATSTISADPGITVTQLTPTIKFTVNVNGAKGKAFKVKFDFTGTTTPPPTTPGTTVIVDNAGTGMTKVGSWTTASTATDKYLTNYIHDSNTGQGTKSVTFTPTLTGSGMYNVYIWWPAHMNRATIIPVDIVHASGTTSVSIDQTSDGGQWNLVGSYEFAAGTTGYVKIRTDGANGYVTADAVKFEPTP
ncbi:Xanthan lyase [Paenibacillus allorhizoplanae]|uniref:Xanthan lyase n=1 Tax=Paenibacillus allorhizoplanae TaxID=2905648 RepID=A0ABN8GI51_9BACL|nr:polysaccharide lyase family 8 super-sandwich domain-containing protein [Paenibacillus allorhizoplanae]CAH1207910.1 Xanthan lyase [Paenibacillus allorhizoplanae]